MKKMNNKGFSLVELIIVIAIMAILAASIAPALIRYIDKSRKSNDITAAGTIKTAVDSALANEAAYDEVQVATKTASAPGVLMVKVSNKSLSAYSAVFSTEVSSNLSTIPGVKYTKNGADSFTVYIDNKGQITVCLEGGSSKWTIQPTICADYQ